MKGSGIENALEVIHASNTAPHMFTSHVHLTCCQAKLCLELLEVTSALMPP